jgi:hypothetical protein
MKAAREGRRKECFAMLRKNRSTALILVLALLISLAGQAAMAMPMAPRQALGEGTAGSFLGAIWEWLAAKWPGLGHLVAPPARQVPRAWEKGAGGSDPNGGAQNNDLNFGGGQGPAQP